MSKILIAMSGGVDSSVAALIMKNQGNECHGVTMKLHGMKDSYEGGCLTTRDIEDARKICEKIEIPYSVVDFSEDFDKYVIKSFISAYENGATPNPCIECNYHLKFDKLFDYGRKLGYHKIVTGHYARIEYDEKYGRNVLKKAIDTSKDQSYVLFRLTKEQLDSTLFPLGKYSKDEIRAMAHDAELGIEGKKDSQDICFIPDGDYRAFLDGRIGHPDRTGDFVLKDGRTLGTHSGLRNYTIGQRKGLGIAYTEPLYVISKNACDNSILLGSDSDLFTDRIYVSGCSFSGMDYPRESFRCTLTARYRGREVGATVTPLVGGRAVIELDVPLRAVTAGQSAVFYDGDVLLGGGVIE